MRATLGRVAVVVLLSVGLCGCKTGSNMFGWGKKKPDNSKLSEAPPYTPTNPALPSAGQTPNGIQTNVPGTGLAAVGAAGTNAAATSPAAAGSYAASPAGYQQSPYLTTPFSQSKLGASSTPGVSSAGASANPAAASGPRSSYPGGYASAVGTGNPLPPPVGYSPGASPTAPQNGFYNPAYGGVASASTAPAYAITAASNPAYNYNAPAASSASVSAQPSAAPASEYRMADARGTASAAPVASSTVGDRYSNASSSEVGARYSTPTVTAPVSQPGFMPPSAAPVSVPPTSLTPTSAAPPSAMQSSAAPPVAMQSSPAPSSAAPAASMPSTITIASSSTGDRYSQQPAAEYHASATSYGSSTVSSAPEASAAPAIMSNPATSAEPMRSEPGYRPGGTSDFKPAGNVLRPALEGSSDGASQSTSSPSQTSGVMPASYRTGASSPAPSKPVVVPVSATQPIDERYGAYQGATPSAEPAYGASSPASAQPASFTQHSW